MKRCWKDWCLPSSSASLVWRFKALQRPGLIAGLFLLFYAFGRTVSEQYREPDAFVEGLPEWITMGQILSIPMWVGGAFLVWNALKKPSVTAQRRDHAQEPSQKDDPRVGANFGRDLYGPLPARPAAWLLRDPSRPRSRTSSPRRKQARCSGSCSGLWAAHEWQEMGAPERFSLVEIGPGRGVLMADALRATRGVAGFHAALELHFIDPSPVLQGGALRAAFSEYDAQFLVRSERPTQRPTVHLAGQ